MIKVLRDYQNWCIDGNERFPGILAALAEYRSTLAVLATGLGKTTIGARVCNDWRNGNVLWLAHRIELLDQAADDLACELEYRPSIEQGPRGLDPDSLFAAGHVVVGSIQSMVTERRRKKFRDHPFGLIVIDEAHRATSASYVKLLDYYPQAKILGITATPNRTDGTAMGLVFASVAYEMGIVDGIDAGWLVDIHQKFAVVENLDLSKVTTRKNQFGEADFNADELEELLSQEGPLHAMSRPVLDCTADGQQAIIFTASVRHAHLWAAVLNHYRPDCAMAIDGSMAKGENTPRTEIVKRFKGGDLQFLLNYNIATEGFDAPKTSFVIMGRPTKSRLVYTQMLGRCTRPLKGVVDGPDTAEGRKDAIAASDKPYATVLDFVGASRMGIVTATDVLGGNFDVDVRSKADDIIGARGSANVREAITKARATLLVEIEEQRRKPLRQIVRDVELAYHLSDVSPFNGAGTATIAPTSRGGATDAQVAALVNLGVPRETALGYSKRQAGAVMDNLRAKRCTERQAKTLVKYGFNPAEFNAEMASAQIQQIADKGWVWP